MALHEAVHRNQPQGVPRAALQYLPEERTRCLWYCLMRSALWSKTASLMLDKSLWGAGGLQGGTEWNSKKPEPQEHTISVRRGGQGCAHHSRKQQGTGSYHQRTSPSVSKCRTPSFCNRLRGGGAMGGIEIQTLQVWSKSQVTKNAGFTYSLELWY